MQVEVSGRQFNFPPQCACCGVAANSRLTVAVSKSSGKKVVHTKTNTWDFPYCSGCLGHIQAARNATAMSGVITLVSVIFGLFVWFKIAFWLGAFFSFVGLGASVFVYNNLMAQAKSQCVPQCACVKEAVAFLAWDGSRQVFEIASSNYALSFMVANEKKLVNISPGAQSLLEASGYGHQSNKPQSARRYSR